MVDAWFGRGEAGLMRGRETAGTVADVGAAAAVTSRGRG